MKEVSLQEPSVRKRVRQLFCRHGSLSSQWAEYHKGKLKINEKVFEQCDDCGKVLVNKPNRIKEIEVLERKR